MAKAAVAQATVTLKHLAAALAETHEMAKKQSELILNDLVSLVHRFLGTDHLRWIHVIHDDLYPGL